ncbi:MAG: response regulator [Chloroflexales bacterium]|nr:response regulator [Chloroflexales bacterium]
MAPTGTRLLIIDDSPEDLAVYRYWLHRALGEGLVIAQAELGADGLELARTENPDCILLDFRLPDSDGLAWLTAYRDATAGPAPVIMLTGHADEELALQAIRAGADDYLQKHEVTPARLVFVIRRAIEHTRMRRAREEADALLGAVLAAAPMGVAFFDPDLRFRHVNPQLAAINDALPEAHLGRRVEEIAPDIAPYITPPLAEVRDTGKAILNIEFQRAHRASPDIERHWQLGYFPVHTHEGQLLGVGALVMEVTERARASAAMASFAARTALIAEAADAFAATRLDTGAILGILAEHLTTQASDRCLIWRLTDNSLEYELVAWDSTEAAVVTPPTLSPLLATAVDTRLRDGQPLRLSTDRATTTALLPLAEMMAASDVLAVPIVVHGQTFGFALVGRVAAGEAFSDEELLVATELARRAALSLSNALLLEQVRTAEAALRQAKDTLEARVAERTATLLAREQQLHSALAEKEVLLKEVHHRVKNNLQVIISLLRLQSRRGVGAADAAQLRDTQHRIQAMALVHEQLYAVGDLGRIELAAYARQLLTGLLRSYTGQSGQVSATVAIPERLQISLDVAIPLGLIMTELLTNSLKYAFPDGRQGTVTLAATITSGELRLLVSDDGVGLPASDSLTQSRGMGGQLIRQLAQQLRGTVTAVLGTGTSFEIGIPYVERESGAS